MTAAGTERPRVVSRDEWLAARTALLQEEKELTRRRDAVARRRLELPWVKVEKEYRFEGPDGPETLADLFAGRSQLIVYHFMFGPEWKEGCPGCSFLADHIDGSLPHLARSDVTLLAVSRAPYAKLEAFRRRMGWRFRWVSSHGSDFNYDYGVSFTPEQLAAGGARHNFAPLPPGASVEELPGASVFWCDPDGDVYHTYSTYARGLDPMIGAYHWLDIAPKGRDEEGLPFPMAWVRHHDRYDGGPVRIGG